MLTSECDFEHKNQTYTFEYPCASTSNSECHGCYTLFSPGMYRFQLWGASGGDGEIGIGGYGGFSQGYYTVKSKTGLYLYIGGKGIKSTSGTIVPGGFNGGGNGGIGTERRAAGSGGGATDIRKSLNPISRIVVAAGGGGGGGWDGKNQFGGSGGGLNGSYSFSNYDSAIQCSPPGTEAGPGIGRIANGTSDGQGGSATAAFATNSDSCGGGGGGYYGGGIGGSSIFCGGGGGSSYIKGLESFLGDTPFTTSGESTKYIGNGKIVITLIIKNYNNCTNLRKYRNGVSPIAFILIFVCK